MYYIVNQNGGVDGPHPYEWVRTNAGINTLVSHQNTWLKFSEHPDFRAPSEEVFYIINRSGIAEGPYPPTWIRANALADTLVSKGNEWIRYRSHPYFNVSKPRRHKELAAQSSAWLLSRSAIYVIIGVLFATLVLLYTQSYIERSGMHVQHPETPASTLRMALTWLNAYLIILVPAYAIGLIFGGHARLAEVVYAFARAAAVLYILLPVTYFMYWRWFLQQGILLKLLAIFFQFLLVPILCFAFGLVAIREFMKSMSFPAKWRAWSTIISSVLVSSALFLVATRWTVLWLAFVKWLGRQFT